MFFVNLIQIFLSCLLACICRILISGRGPWRRPEETMMRAYSKLLERGLIPDSLIRFYVRRLCRIRLQNEPDSVNDRQEALKDFMELISSQPLAVQTDLPNEQHYEVPTDFFRIVLGRNLKYSSCLFPEGAVQDRAADLEEAERRMLQLTCDRALLADGQDILELGCGWGSLTLFMAEKFPRATITAVSNSRTQKEYIDSQAAVRGLRNVNVITADMKDFDPARQYDRIVSVEMIEHMRNYKLLMEKLGRLLRSGGKLFVHIFTYNGTPYLYDSSDPGDWMARYFFAGGMMPSPGLLPFFAAELILERQWEVNGQHYQRTLEGWLERMDAQMDRVKPILIQAYGAQARKFQEYWRIFFMACAEVFGYEAGNRWFISHYLFSKP